MAKLKRLRKIVEDNNSQTSENDATHFSRFNSLQAASKPTSSHMESSQSEFHKLNLKVSFCFLMEFLEGIPILGNIEKWEKENGRESGRVEFFALTHKRKDGRYDESSQEVLLIEKEAKTENEAFTEVIGKDRYGRIKGYGIGVTPTQLFGVQAQIKNMENGGVDPLEDMRKLQAQIQDMQSNYDSKLLEMQQNYEQKLQGMQKNYESQLEDMKQLLVQIASKLQ
uniref:Uncharacterized protein n=1 Tax=Ananas comosus var. bracteatus TaxID=296719 RepID=A0A6V7QM48_ANACO|nr:unnamed protein product [Ananas comosus var. bracteatus]